MDGSLTFPNRTKEIVNEYNMLQVEFGNIYSSIRNRRNSCHMFEIQNQLLVECLEWVSDHERSRSKYEGMISNVIDRNGVDSNTVLVLAQEYSENISKTKKHFDECAITGEGSLSEMRTYADTIQKYARSMENTWKSQRLIWFKDMDINRAMEDLSENREQLKSLGDTCRPSGRTTRRSSESWVGGDHDFMRTEPTARSSLNSRRASSKVDPTLDSFFEKDKATFSSTRNKSSRSGLLELNIHPSSSKGKSFGKASISRAPLARGSDHRPGTSSTPLAIHDSSDSDESSKDVFIPSPRSSDGHEKKRRRTSRGGSRESGSESGSGGEWREESEERGAYGGVKNSHLSKEIMLEESADEDEVSTHHFGARNYGVHDVVDEGGFAVDDEGARGRGCEGSGDSDISSTPPTRIPPENSLPTHSAQGVRVHNHTENSSSDEHLWRGFEAFKKFKDSRNSSQGSSSKKDSSVSWSYGKSERKTGQQSHVTQQAEADESSGVVFRYEMSTFTPSGEGNRDISYAAPGSPDEPKDDDPDELMSADMHTAESRYWKSITPGKTPTVSPNYLVRSADNRPFNGDPDSRAEYTNREVDNRATNGSDDLDVVDLT